MPTKPKKVTNQKVMGTKSILRKALPIDSHFCFVFVLFLFCFSFFAAFSVFVPFFFFFSHPIVLPVICQCLSLFYRFAQHVAGGEWTVATIPAHIILSLYQTFPILSIISMSFLFFFVRLLILSITYQCWLHPTCTIWMWLVAPLYFTIIGYWINGSKS